MTLKSLRITNERHGGRRLVYVNSRRVWLQNACVDMMFCLSHHNDWIEDAKISAAPGNVSRYVYEWHKELDTIGYPVKLFENNRKHGWRLTIPIESVTFETKPGGVPDFTQRTEISPA